jgi:hypothetical protein
MGLMLPGTVATHLFLVCAILFPHHLVVSATCTKEDKYRILYNVDCWGYLRRDPEPHANVGEDCCREVRQVPDMDTECVYRLLTKKEIEHVLPLRVRYLRNRCAPAAPRSPPPPRR